MRTISALFVAVTLLAALPAHADSYVNGYVKKDGTYVPPHFKSNNDNNAWNNYSTKGNANPYTGEKGYVDPYKSNSGSSFGSSYRRPKY